MHYPDRMDLRAAENPFVAEDGSTLYPVVDANRSETDFMWDQADLVVVNITSGEIRPASLLMQSKRSRFPGIGAFVGDDERVARLVLTTQILPPDMSPGLGLNSVMEAMRDLRSRMGLPRHT